ncbi:resolvase [Moraxella atlantae]|uniref:Resolvase n=1 Tax=Faucicola atlantae TaxID=34059 RepID=A0A1B8QKI8_9GAMM|nr:resolvase [Moraxella atlantae]
MADALSWIINGWSHLVSGVPADQLPIIAYVGFSLVALAIWALIARLLPQSLAGLSWIILCAILLTPTTSLGVAPEIAPASIAVVYGVLMKEPSIIFKNLLPIMVVITVGCILGFLWQIMRMGLDKARAKRVVATETTVTETVTER